MKKSCVALVGLLACAGAALAGPELVKLSPTKTEPVRVRGVKLVDGKVVPTTAWMPYVSGGFVRDAVEYGWDGYESGSNSPGLAPNGNRYTLGDAGIPYNQSALINDMTFAPGFDGATSEFLDLVFEVQAGNQDFSIAVFTAEDELDGTCGDVTASAYDGVQLGFAPTAGFFFSNIDLTGTGLFWQLPNDGVGSSIILFDDTITGGLAKGQIGLWFTGEDMTPPQNRRGTNTPKQASDDQTTPTTCVTIQALTAAQNIPDGLIDLACECHDYTFGAPEGDPLTTCLAFAAEGGAGCYADCDGSGGLNIFDYICFGNAYGAQQPYADCDGSGTFNIFDYICFGNAYGAGCP